MVNCFYIVYCCDNSPVVKSINYISTIAGKNNFVAQMGSRHNLYVYQAEMCIIDGHAIVALCLVTISFHLKQTLNSAPYWTEISLH